MPVEIPFYGKRDNLGPLKGSFESRASWESSTVCKPGFETWIRKAWKAHVDALRILTEHKTKTIEDALCSTLRYVTVHVDGCLVGGGSLGPLFDMDHICSMPVGSSFWLVQASGYERPLEAHVVTQNEPGFVVRNPGVMSDAVRTAVDTFQCVPRTANDLINDGTSVILARVPNWFALDLGLLKPQVMKVDVDKSH